MSPPNETGPLEGRSESSPALTTHRQDSGRDLTVERYAEAKLFDADKLRSWGVEDDTYAGRPAVRLTYWSASTRKPEKEERRWRISLNGGNNFRWTKGASAKRLYGWDRVDRSNPTVLLVEGESDCHALWTAGFRNVLGVPGVENVPDSIAQQLKWAETVYAIDEQDDGSPRLLSSLAARLGDKLRIVTVRPDAKDFSELWIELKGDRQRFKVAVRGILEDWREPTDKERDKKKRTSTPIRYRTDGGEVQNGGLEFLTLAELAARVDAAGPRKYLIRGTWPSDAYGVHAAPMKGQKTWNVSDLAVSVASGTPWLDHFAIDDPGAVLMFAGEGDAASIVRRLRAVCDSRGLDPNSLPIHICTRAPHLRDNDHMQEFADKVDELRPKLVILDPLYLSAVGAKSGDLYAMGELLERAQLICDSIGSALMVVTHFNRGNKSGAERITGAGPAEWGRVLIGVDVKSRHTDPETKGTTVVTAFDVIGGEVPDQSWRVKRHIVADDPDSLDSPLRYSVEVIEGEDDRSEDDMSPARRKLLEAVNAVGGTDGATNSELVDWIADKYGHGLYRTTVSAQLNELARSGLVDSIESAGNPTLWLPTEGVAGVAATPTRHPTTGDTGRVS